MQDPLNSGKTQFSDSKEKTPKRVFGHLQVNDSDRHGKAEQSDRDMVPEVLGLLNLNQETNHLITIFKSLNTKQVQV